MLRAAYSSFRKKKLWVYQNGSQKESDSIQTGIELKGLHMIRKCMGGLEL
jgi:hypothetical protein